MVEKASKKRIFKKGKIPLGKKSRKAREKKIAPAVNEIKGKKWHIELPNINRFIAEWKQKILVPSWFKEGWAGVIVLGGGLLIWQLVAFGGIYPSFSRLISERNMLEEQLRTWENIASHYPTYRDAHFEVAVLAYKLGKRDVMESELKKVLEMDPNFQLALDLQKQE